MNQKLAKRVLLYCVFDHRGGIETHIKNLAAVLVDRGAEVHIAAKWVKSPEVYLAIFEQLGVRLVFPRYSASILGNRRLPAKLKTLFVNLLAELTFRRSLIRGSYDLVSINATGLFGYRMIRYAKQTGGCVTYHEHQTLSQSLDTSSEYVRLLQSMDFVSVNSRRDASTAGAVLNSATQGPHILPALAPHISCPENICKPVGSPFRVAFIGNVGATEKGAHKLLEIWKKRAPEGMLLTFYGGGAASLGPLDDIPNVRAVGPFHAHEIGRVFEDIDLLVHPANDESLGLVLIEAMAHGVPFLATHVGGIVDIADQNPNVMTVRDDLDAIYLGILHMRRRLETGDLDRQALRFDYEKKWSHAALGKRWADLYLMSNTTTRAETCA